MFGFRNVSVKMKMLFCVGICLLLTITAAVFAIEALRLASDSYDTTIDHPLALQNQLLEFQGQFRDVRRYAYAISTYAGADTGECESLYASAQTSISSMLEKLSEAEVTLNTNPKLQEEQKTARLQILGSLRGLISEFDSEVLTPIIEAARQNDRAGTINILQNETVAPQIREVSTTLINGAGETAAAFVQESKALSESSYLIVIIALVVAGLVAIAISVIMSGQITKPLKLLTAFVGKAAATGDIHLKPEDEAVIQKYGAYKDETGQTITATASFVRRVSEVSKMLDTVANGDLSADIVPLTDKDVLGVALHKMTKNLNTMFQEINASSSLVSAGSQQIADGAQALAAGSTEQAASIQELSSSISEVAERTKENSVKADQAAKLADTIKEDAEKGNGQMNEMMQSVQEISEASHSISKVIKTIDDIAFQTNILALNAAVEAARAGQHGKGFAVVAEEVRNLSAKSAQAAKDTESLIADSMKKAEQGVRIANETAASLTNIVSGINESTELITEIAKASEEQSINISQINAGIDQVAKVVQQNSATSEEAAAASQEMSSQSAVLRELIAQFHLKDNNHIRRLGARRTESAMIKRLAAAEGDYRMVEDSEEFGKY